MNRRLFIQTLAASTYGLKTLDAKDAPIASKAKNVIYICLDGGMSHIDSFDPKDDKEVMGDTTKISTKVSGIELGNRLPKLAEVVDKMSIIRSTHSKTGAHEQAQYLNRTSYRQIGSIVHPSLGSWVAHIQDREKDIPDYVLISGSSAHPNSGFLPKVKSPLPIIDPNGGLKNSKVDNKLEERMNILREINSKFKAPLASEYNEFYDNTVRFLKSKDLELFDLTKENPEARSRYGNTKLGQGCLLARRLIEHDVRCVEVVKRGWDTHAEMPEDKARDMDKAFAALMQDLTNTGLIDSTIVVLATEFGRNPNIKPDNLGRDHWAKAFSCVIGGGGLKTGQIIGSTDRGHEVMENKIEIPDLHTTIATAMGMPAKEIVMSESKRPFNVGYKGKVISELI